MPSKKGSPIALELKAIGSKIQEFREYLNNTQVEHIKDYNERHQEIKVQILLLKELGPLVAQYDIMKRQSEQPLENKPAAEIRGDLPLSPLEDGLI